MSIGFGLKETLAPTLSLFLSAGTLLCCALPALLVSLGMGAALAGLVGTFPQITILSEYKAYVFGGAALMLAIAGFLMWKARNLPCPAEAKKAKACARLRKVSIGIYLFSVVIFLIGAFFAFAAQYVLL